MEKTYLKDYAPSDFQIPVTHLDFDIQIDHTVVTSKLSVKKVNPKASFLLLDGEELSLQDIQIDGKPLPASSYQIDPKTLKILNVPDQFELQIKVKIYPDRNTSLSGLYQSGTNLITQCEAQGFRRITYYLDRPDVMSSFTVKVTADSKKFPVLLSNGDLIETKVNQGSTTVTWKDPHKKPCYLFALVAGNLGVIKDHFTTRSGRRVKLEIYSEHTKLDQCHYAMESLQKAMKWDEDRYGLEYDLDTYMIVATDDFNAGAMENKGLNVFNSRLIVASPKTATDQRFEAIESVVAHEYFHNWTGNRVTLRDWFHLSLKEGLTVFRDQEFSMDQISRDLVRIQNVVDLRESQFAEDQGPNAHPIRPESCYSVDNFFTSTIYEKGSEVIRMMQTMVGRPGFRKGMDLYFKRHDGQAVIIEDFASAISDANGIPSENWNQFKLWYSQAGTPTVQVSESFDAANETYQLNLKQSTAPTPGQDQKLPFHIPLEIEFLTSTGEPLTVQTKSLERNSEGKQLFHLKKPTDQIQISGLKSKPLVSLNRSFSAPIVLNWERSQKELLTLFAKDTDAFNRWEAGQTLYQIHFNQLLQNPEFVNPELGQAVKAVLADSAMSPALKAQMITLPSINYMAQITPDFKAERFQLAHDRLALGLAKSLQTEFEELYSSLRKQESGRIDAHSRGLRSLKNRALSYLAWSPIGVQWAEEQYFGSSLMTDQESALAILIAHSEKPAEKALQHYFETWKDDGLMLNSWWRLQATAEKAGTFEKVKNLAQHPRFKLTNPNCVYMLFGAFGDNVTQFHTGDGQTYKFLCEKLLEVDRLNPQVAARLASSFDFCLKADEQLKSRARQNLKALVGQGLSSNSFEIVSKTLSSLGG